MCVLTARWERTKRARAKKASGRPFWAYKVLSITGKAPYQKSTKGPYGPGVNRGGNAPRSKRSYGISPAGLHLYWNRKSAESCWLMHPMRYRGSVVGRVVIPVRVYPRDIIVGDDEQLAVRKLTIAPRTWRRVLKTAGEKVRNRRVGTVRKPHVI